MSLIINPYAYDTGGGGGGGIADPTELTGNVLWLKADSFTGLSDGDSSGVWVDQSPAGNDVGNSTTAQQPTYQTGVLNSMPVLRSDGTQHLVNGSATSLPGADDWMIWGVWSNRSTGTSEQTPINLGSGTNGYGPMLSTNTNKKGALFDNVAWINSAVAEATGFEVWVLQRRSGTTRLWVNGAAPIATSSSVPAAPANDVWVFRSDNRGSMDADIAECGVHDGASSLSDADAIGNYLADRWGLTWSTASDS